MAAKAWSSALYGPLPLSDDHLQTRILRIRRGESDTPLNCTLFRSTLVGANYEALSYTWGTDERSNLVLVNGIHVGVTKNLQATLLALRQCHPEALHSPCSSHSLQSLIERPLALSEVRPLQQDEVFARAGSGILSEHLWLVKAIAIPNVKLRFRITILEGLDSVTDPGSLCELLRYLAYYGQYYNQISSIPWNGTAGILGRRLHMEEALETEWGFGLLDKTNKFFDEDANTVGGRIRYHQSLLETAAWIFERYLNPSHNASPSLSMRPHEYQHLNDFIESADNDLKSLLTELRRWQSFRPHSDAREALMQDLNISTSQISWPEGASHATEAAMCVVSCDQTLKSLAELKLAQTDSERLGLVMADAAAQPGDEIVLFPNTVAPKLVRTLPSDGGLNRSVLVGDVYLHWLGVEERMDDLVIKGKQRRLILVRVCWHILLMKGNVGMRNKRTDILCIACEDVN